RRTGDRLPAPLGSRTGSAAARGGMAGTVPPLSQSRSDGNAAARAADRLPVQHRGEGARGSPSNHRSGRAARRHAALPVVTGDSMIVLLIVSLAVLAYVYGGYLL